MRNLLLSISLLFLFPVFGQKLNSSKYNFGKVKEWNNPIIEFTYTNTSNKVQYFLPIAYKSDILVNFGKPKLNPGESTSIKTQYFTSEFGRFSKDIPIFVSTEAGPINISISGNIMSFHVDALTVCPAVGRSDMPLSKEFKHGILVVDALTKEPVTDFYITLETKSSKEEIYSRKSSLSVKREKPDWYTIEIDKEEYDLAQVEIYINKHSPMTIIELSKGLPFPEEVEEVVEEEVEAPVTEVSEPEEAEVPVVQETKPKVPVIDDNDSEDIPDDSEAMEEVPVDVIVEIPPTPKPNYRDSADFTDDGVLNENKYAYNHLVFVIDVSGSMNKPSKLPLLKHSMKEMIKVLRPQDKISIITYATTTQVLVASIQGSNKEVMYAAIDRLQARGQSHGSEGVDMAYNLALENFIADGNNEIIVVSDGVFNSGNFKEKKLYRKAFIQYKSNEIKMSAVGFGKSPKALGFLDTLAKRGSGSFIQITSEQQAETMLIDNMMQHSIKN